MKRVCVVLVIGLFTSVVGSHTALAGALRSNHTAPCIALTSDKKCAAAARNQKARTRVQEFVTPTSVVPRMSGVQSVPSAPYGITLGPDGALWFTENGANKIGRTTTDGSFKEFTIPPPVRGLLRIVAGPDGALWFTEYAANKIGRITTAGVVSEYDIPGRDVLPSEIVAGPDGALWFTEAGANKIGRITTTGSFSEFEIPTAASTPWAIAVGPDGALWFTEYDANKIGRITTSGSIREFNVPSPLSLPSGITAGPDGALWFTENGGEGQSPPGKVGRLAIDGTFSEFQIPIGSSNKKGMAAPTAITAGPDGALWFAAAGAGEIERVTTGGRFTRFAISTPTSGPQGVAVGADGKLWFTELNTAKVGKVNVKLTSREHLHKWLNATTISRLLGCQAGAPVDNGATQFVQMIDTHYLTVHSVLPSGLCTSCQSGCTQQNGLVIRK